jgi:RecA-family ATPase
MVGPPYCDKTAIALPLAISVADGRPFAGHETTAGKVAWIATENDRDARKRFLGTCKEMGIDPENEKRIRWVPRPLPLSKLIDELLARLEEIGPILVVIDTDQATFAGTDENDNAAP